MNSFIETLNQWGGIFLNFAWPMLWQSSLLITFVFALNLLLARKIRASIRYALWLAVLVKLLLPPTLALPTSAAWWLFQHQPAIAAPVAKKYVVTYDSTAPPADFVPQTAPVRAPEPKLDSAGGAFLGSVTVSAGLLLWLGFRWRQVTRKVRGATVSGEFAGTLEAAQQMAGLRSGVRLKIVDGQMSPAMCGLLNPVILLPRTLVEKLSAGQLRAVLLHELFHLRRKDVWVNCAQALLQILYWWHPLLWLANARIRRVREEAVDDAVMLALREEAEDYAPTLLEVARLAFRRPRLRLGLVGIMESRNALRQRIERLVNFRAPRKAGLTFVSLCGIFVFSAVALPMGEAPAQTSNSTLSAASDNLNQTNPNVPMTNDFPGGTSVMDEKIKADQLVRDARVNYEMGKFDGAEKLLESALALDSENGAAKYYLELTQAARQSPGISQTGPGREEILAKLNQIHLARFGPFDGLTLDQVVQNLNDAVKQEGVRLTIASGSNSIPAASIDPVTGMPVKQTELASTDAKSITISLFPAMENVSLLNALKAVTSGASRPIKFSVQEDGIVFSKGASDATLLFTRTFNVGAHAFTDASRNVTGLQTTNVWAIARSLFGKLGVDWESPKGKAMFYNNGLSLLYVRATESDLNTIERAIQALNYSAPQIHIKARFLEVPKGTLDGFTKTIVITNSPDQLVGILTGENTKVAMKMLESRADVEELAEPEVTTLSGRQTEMRATEIITVITNFIFTKNLDTQSNSITPQTTKVETGPILDVVPYVLSDGYTINLTAIPSLTEFLGYDTPPTKPVERINDSGEHVPVILPSFGVREANAHIKLWDGQTMVLGPLKARFYDGGKEVSAEPDYFVKTKLARGRPDKELLVFITVNLVDAAGNRIHSDDEMPFAKGAIPPQDDPVSRPQ